MNRIAQVLVSRNSIQMTCWADKTKDGLTYRCGGCGRGSLGPVPKKGDECSVCHSPVVQVVEIPEPHVQQRPDPFSLGM